MSNQSVAIEFADGPVEGEIEVLQGTLAELRLARGEGRVSGKGFAVASSGPCRLEATIEDAATGLGANAALVSVGREGGAFSFFLRDVSAEHPILIPEYATAVVPAEDDRSYAEIAEAVRVRGLCGGLQGLACQPEETYENACRLNRDMMCPTWLGLSRDMRIFRVGYSKEWGYWGNVVAAYHSPMQKVPETGDAEYGLDFCIGPGASCRVQVTRRLEDGALPILRSEQREEDMTYHLTAFATLETQPLRLDELRGSDWRAVYPNTFGHMLQPEEIEEIRDLMEQEMRGRDEEVVCCIRVEAVNTGEVPRYAWFRSLRPNVRAELAPFDGATGMAGFESGRIFAVHRLQGGPMPQEEMAVLVAPGEAVTLDMLIPHQPISRERALALSGLDFDEHLRACRTFWRAKLRSAASVRVPEAAVDERIRAGLLHCDLVALGKEPDGNVLATIGWYGPIGSESSPIIQFFDSMGWHSLAERSLNFFLDRQREDGFIQNFGGYQLETGSALWSMGEHYRYTRDEKWVRRIKPRLLKACEYLLDWRERNRTDDLRGRGYGLQEGKVGDPNDFYHNFMLNGLSYVGIRRVSEMLAEIDPDESARLDREATAYREDIRTAFYEAMARSPVIPTGDGTWCPSSPPWAEYRGPLALYAEGGNWFTHGAFGSRDSLAGPRYLILSEVLEPDEPGATFLLRSHHELFTRDNAGLSQPYYCRHDYAHIRRGEVNAFLKTYYNQFTALQDRETYTFWEHYFHASQHKTHEEGWFLMQTRWMLYLEAGETLTLLPAIPRAWLADGKVIELSDVASYFGKVSLRVESQLSDGRIRAEITCDGPRKPSAVELRLPHPEGRRASAVAGGEYLPGREAVRIAPWSGRATVELVF